MNIVLTEQEAYAAMYAFLVKIYDRTESSDLGGLLGDMSTLPDGEAFDPALRDEWIECVEKAKKGEIQTDMELHSPPLF